MGNLLFKNQSFDWIDIKMPRGKLIDDLNIALTSAREAEDNIYRTPDLYEFESSWGKLFEFLWGEGIEYENFNKRFEWISPDQFRILSSLPDLLRLTSPQNSSDYGSFLQEFTNENNSWIGTYDESHTEPIVFDYLSWLQFHQRFVATFDFNRRRAEYKYFSKFFKPGLTRPVNLIQHNIDQHNTHASFQSIHTPQIPHEKIHIHFISAQNCALNIDGTWKHEVRNFRIERRACEILSEWGFLLPREYYD